MNREEMIARIAHLDKYQIGRGAAWHLAHAEKMAIQRCLDEGTEYVSQSEQDAQIERVAKVVGFGVAFVVAVIIFGFFKETL